MAAPVKQDLCFTRGDDWAFRLIMTEDDESPSDLTGYNWRSQIRVKPDDTAAIATFDVDINLVDAEVTFTLARSITETLNGPYAYDIEEIDPSGNLITTFAGRIISLADVTRLP